MSTFFQRLFHRTDSRHADAITRTADMVRSKDATALAQRHGLSILDLTWEDTARYKGSCVGPNISDMTIQVASSTDSGAPSITCMPVIRFPNFSDKTADVSIDDLRVRVGNERGKALSVIGLRAYLRDLRKYLTDPSSWAGTETSLLAPRETEVLVSAQAC